MLTRRQWMQGAGGLLSLAALAKVAKARSSERGVPAVTKDTHFFLFAQVYGAWDVCLAWDPKDRELRLPGGDRAFDQPYSWQEVRDFGHGLILAPQAAPLAKYADRLAVINGIDMEVDMGHITDIVMSGGAMPRQSNRPFVQTLLAKRHPYLRSCSIPHLYASYDGQFFGGPYAASSVNATPPDFLSIFNSPDSSSAFSEVQAMVGELQASTSDLPRRRALGSYINAVGRARNVGSQLRAAKFSPPADVSEVPGLGNVLGQLFASGVLGAATLSFGEKYSFDTHSDHYKQHPMDKLILDVTGLCDELAKVKLDDNTSVLERTTVVLTGEFCRTPRLNGAAGKDHNVRTNSLAMLGYQVKPGMHGVSGLVQRGRQWEAHAGLPIDLRTGEPQADAHVLKISNLWAGFGAVAGADLSQDFGADVVPVGFLA